MNYKIEPWGDGRWRICSLDGLHEDTSDGHGYHTYNSASRAAFYKYKAKSFTYEKKRLKEKDFLLNDPECNLLDEEKQPYLDKIERDLQLLKFLR